MLARNAGKLCLLDVTAVTADVTACTRLTYHHIVTMEQGLRRPDILLRGTL